MTHTPLGIPKDVEIDVETVAMILVLVEGQEALVTRLTPPGGVSVPLRLRGVTPQRSQITVTSRWVVSSGLEVVIDTTWTHPERDPSSTVDVDVPDGPPEP